MPFYINHPPLVSKPNSGFIYMYGKRLVCVYTTGGDEDTIPRSMNGERDVKD